MGADLITYFCYGPKKLRDDQKTEALKQGHAAHELAQKIVEIEKKAINMEDEDAGDAWRMKELEKLDMRPLRHLAEEPPEAKRSITILIAENDDTYYDIEVLASVDVNEVVKDFFAIWNNQEHCRDCVSRDVPGLDDMKGVVVGELSWGDEPEGWGYQTVKKALLLGIFPILGVS